MNSDLFKKFESYFPIIATNVISCRDISEYEIEFVLADGSAFVYDDLNKSIRKLPQDHNMTEAEYRKEFGIRLRRMLMIKHVTQTDLSGMTGISQTIISKYINGQNTPGFYAVDKICRALGCSADDFRYLK